MKKIKKLDCSLKDYKLYQKSIRTLGIGDDVFLSLKEKENGFKDVFAFDTENNIIGEFFREESLEIFPFVSNGENFELKAKVKKFITKEDDFNAVVLDIEIDAPDNFDENEFMKKYTKKESSNPIQFKNDVQQVSSPPKKSYKGCLVFFVIAVIFTLFVAVISKSEDNKNIENNSIDSTSVVDSKKSRLDSSKIKSLKHLFTEKKDDFNPNTWVKPKSRPYYVNQNGFYCYFSKDSNGNVFNFRFVGQYAAEDWLFIKYLKFNIDGKNYDFYPIKIETDNDSTIWEWFDEQIKINDSDLIEAIANAKSVKVRFEGRQYYKDKIMSQSNILSIKNTLEYYKAQGGSF